MSATLSIPELADYTGFKAWSLRKELRDCGHILGVKPVVINNVKRFPTALIDAALMEQAS